MDDPREFLKEAAAAEEPEVFGHMRAEMTRIRASLPAEGTPLGDVGKVPSAAEFLKDKEPDDWLIDQWHARLTGRPWRGDRSQQKQVGLRNGSSHQ